LALATSCLPLVISQEEQDLSPYTAQAAIAVPLISYGLAFSASPVDKQAAGDYDSHR